MSQAGHELVFFEPRLTEPDLPFGRRLSRRLRLCQRYARRPRALVADEARHAADRPPLCGLQPRRSGGCRPRGADRHARGGLFAPCRGRAHAGPDPGLGPQDPQGLQPRPRGQLRPGGPDGPGTLRPHGRRDRHRQDRRDRRPHPHGLRLQAAGLRCLSEPRVAGGRRELCLAGRSLSPVGHHHAALPLAAGNLSHHQRRLAGPDETRRAVWSTPVAGRSWTARRPCGP